MAQRDERPVVFTPPDTPPVEALPSSPESPPVHPRVRFPDTPPPPIAQSSKLSLKDAVDSAKADTTDNCQKYWIIDPLQCTWLSYWDILTTLALAYTALVTPVEVAFLPSPPYEERGTNGLFLFNRMVDIVFIIDMMLQFRVAVKITDSGGTRWLRRPEQVASRYLKSWWFWLDGFSISTSLFDILPLNNAQSLTALRAVRVLRLAKLVRLLRGSRIFKKWELRMSINYAYLSVFNITASIIMTIHWMACFWGLQASFTPLQSWYAAKEYCTPWGDESQKVAMEMSCPADRPVCEIGDCDGTTCTGGYACVPPWNMYSYSLYFAVMTITSVGYGDIVPLPLNATEQIICSFIMLTSGMLWGYLIGTFCGLAASLSPSVQVFRADLSALNSMMSIYSLPSEMRYRLREYVHETQHLRDTEARNNLLTKLSPSMQGEVQLMVNQAWISKIWYLARAEPELLIEVSFSLSALVFPPREFCPAGFMYIVERGSAFYLGRMRAEGSVWGDDVILDDPSLQINIPAIAITYLWVYVMNGEKLNALIRQFPRTSRRLQPIKARLRFRRAVVRAAERRAHEMGVAFRGRMRPIYARDIARKIDAEANRKERRQSEMAQAKLGCGRLCAAAATPSSTAGSPTPTPLSRKLSLKRQLSIKEKEAASIEDGRETRHARLAAQNVGMALRQRQMAGMSAHANEHEPAHNDTASEKAQAASQPEAPALGTLEKRVASVENTLHGFGSQLGRIEEMLGRMSGASPSPGATSPFGREGSPLVA